MKKGKAFIFVKDLFIEVRIPSDVKKKIDGIEPKYCELEERCKEITFNIDKVEKYEEE